MNEALQLDVHCKAIGRDLYHGCGFLQETFNSIILNMVLMNNVFCWESEK